MGRTGRIAAVGSAAGSAAEEEAEAGLVVAEEAGADLTAVIATSTTMEGSESTKCPLYSFGMFVGRNRR